MPPPLFPRPALQLWCVRDDLAVDLHRTLAALSAAGFSDVEPYSARDFPGLGEGLAASGLTATSVHEHLIGVDVEKALDVAQSVGATVVVESWTEPDLWSTDASIAQLAAALNAAAEIAAQRGLLVSYHNHDHEFARGADGEPLYFSFVEQLSPEVRLQVDIGTVSLAGVDPVSVLERYRDRIESVHILGEAGASSLVLQDPRGSIASHIAAIPSNARLIVEIEDGPFSSIPRALAALDTIGVRS